MAERHERVVGGWYAECRCFHADLYIGLVGAAPDDVHPCHTSALKGMFSTALKCFWHGAHNRTDRHGRYVSHRDFSLTIRPANLINLLSSSTRDQ